MERTRSAPLAQDSGFETLADLPVSARLPKLLEAVRSPGVVRPEVDALVRGLASPLAEGESARARADLLLSVIEGSDVDDFVGSKGITLRQAAVKGLLDLGYPYALELPPEALGLFSQARKEEGEARIPWVGLGATAIALLIQLSYMLPGVGQALSKDSPAWGGAFFLLLVAAGPAFSSVFGAWNRISWMQRLGLLTQALTGSVWTVIFLTMLATYAGPFTRLETWAAMGAGLGFLVGAFLMRRRGWLAQDTQPEER